MSQEKQGKKTSQVISDAAVKEVIPTKPTNLSDEDLDKVAGGFGFTGLPVGNYVVETVAPNGTLLGTSERTR